MHFDGHIHIMNDKLCDWNSFETACKVAGIAGGILISQPPPSFRGTSGIENNNMFCQRLEILLSLAYNNISFFPFFWIDPIAENALEQIDAVCEKKIKGFKVICDRFYPYDERAMKVFSHIASKGMPVLFHSGILWDGKASSIYNRPAGFECLQDIAGLKFSLAHISWPWCDELIAVYGKFQNSYSKNPDLSCEMFIDITPGTPPIYRKEALTKLFKVGYDVENNVIFGSDCRFEKYNSEWTADWIKRDSEIYKELELSEETVQKIYKENLLRFVGESNESVSKKPLHSGE
jgi:predicted TIM-barrel fold metal-dependent hydrolase